MINEWSCRIAPAFPSWNNQASGVENGSGGGQDGHSEGDSETLLEEEVLEEQKLKEPPKYACILLNDDYTTMEFVIEVLQKFFRKTTEEAAAIMLRVHQQGQGVAGIYSHDIAETKAQQVLEEARARGFPLKCVIEPMES